MPEIRLFPEYSKYEAVIGLIACAFRSYAVSKSIPQITLFTLPNWGVGTALFPQRAQERGPCGAKGINRRMDILPVAFRHFTYRLEVQAPFP
jgi:hypothetical protein